MKTIFTVLVALTFSLPILSQGNGYLGISMKKASEEGMRISDVLENGAALVYGFQQNDVILSVDGVAVNTAKELKEQVSKNNWGETISISYKRNEQLQLKDVVLGNRANKVTYHVRRQVKGNKVIWNFDYTTYITMIDGVPITINKLEKNKVSYSHNVTTETEMPARFSDLGDKLEIIEAIKERNKGKKYFPTITVYIKTYTEPSKIKVNPNVNLNVELKAFPNPSLGELQFSLSIEEPTSTNLSWQVIDITGKKITEGNLKEFKGLTTQKLDLTNQGAGTYLLRIVNDKQVITERLIVK